MSAAGAITRPVVIQPARGTVAPGPADLVVKHEEPLPAAAVPLGTEKSDPRPDIVKDP